MEVLQYEPIIILFISAFFAALYFLNLDNHNNKSITNEKDELFFLITRELDLKSLLSHIAICFLMIIISIGINNYYPSLDEFYFYNNDFIFSFVIIAFTIFGYYFYALIKYEYNIISIVRQICMVAIVASLIEYFCLRYREPRPNKAFLLCILVGIIFNVVFHYLLGEVRYDLPDNENEKGYKEKPVSTKKELLTSRQKQADYLLSEFRKISSDEPYAVLIDGKWGQGKTSLITAIKNEQCEFRFVYISVGYSVNIKELLYDIEKQIRNIFDELDFYCELSGNMHSYFKTMCRLSAVTVDERIGKIYEAIIQDDETFESKKKDLNDFLDTFYVQTHKRIIVIIDDLERCHQDNIKDIFALLIETCNLHNCITLLVCDYKKLIETKAVSEDYIDKYINRKYTLAYVSHSDVYYQIIFNGLVGTIFESYHFKKRNRWILNFEKMESILSQIEEIGNDENNAKKYSIEKNTYDFFKQYIIKLKEKLSDMLSTPRTSKKIWLLGVKKAVDILEDTKYKDGDYKDIDIDLVAIIYGILLYGLTDIYDEIIQYHGISSYISNYKNININENELLDNYFNYVLISSLFEAMKQKEVMALNWMLFLKDNFDLDDYRTEKEEITEEWNTITDREISNFELYLYYLGDNVNTLKELISFLLEKIDEDISSSYFEKFYLAFINIYNPDNDNDELGDLYECYTIFDKCVDRYLDNSNDDYIFVIDISNKFNIYTSKFFYKRIAELVWVITLSSIDAENIDSAEIYNNVKDNISYIEFLRNVIKKIKLNNGDRDRINYFLNKTSKDIDVYRLTEMVIEACSLNARNNNVNPGTLDLEPIVFNHLEKIKFIERYYYRDALDDSRYINEFIDAFINTEDISNDNMNRIIDVWDQITEETKEKNYMKLMSRLKGVLLLVIDKCNGGYVENVRYLKATIELVRDLNEMFNNIDSNKKSNAIYNEILLLIKAARKKVSSCNSIITKTHSYSNKNDEQGTS